MPRWTRSLSSPIYTPDPVAWESSLNRGLVAWWMGLPHNAGGSTAYNLAYPAHFSLASNVTWTTQIRPGAFSPLRIPDGTTASTAPNPNDLYTFAGTFNGNSGRAPYTLACWILIPTSVNSFAQHFVIGNGGAGTWGIQSALTNLQFFRSNGTTNILSTPFTVNVWNHYVVQYDGATMRSWINGSASNTLASTLAMTTGKTTVGFTSNTNGTSYALQDDIRIWNRALSAGEIAAVYQESRQGHPDTLRRTRSSVVYYLPTVTTASLAATLGSLTLTGTGTSSPPIATGSLTASLGSITLTASGTSSPPITAGNLSAALGSLTLLAGSGVAYGTGPTIGLRPTSAVTGPRPTWASATITTASPTRATGTLTTVDPRHSQGDPS